MDPCINDACSRTHATVYRWGQKDRDADRRLQGADRGAPYTAQFVVRQRVRNHALALGLTGFAVIALGVAVRSAVVYEASRHQEHQTKRPSWHDVTD